VSVVVSASFRAGGGAVFKYQQTVLGKWHEKSPGLPGWVSF